MAAVHQRTGHRTGPTTTPALQQPRRRGPIRLQRTASRLPHPTRRGCHLNAASRDHHRAAADPAQPARGLRPARAHPVRAGRHRQDHRDHPVRQDPPSHRRRPQSRADRPDPGPLCHRPARSNAPHGRRRVRPLPRSARHQQSEHHRHHRSRLRRRRRRPGQRRRSRRDPQPRPEHPQRRRRLRHPQILLRTDPGDVPLRGHRRRESRPVLRGPRQPDRRPASP